MSSPVSRATWAWAALVVAGVLAIYLPGLPNPSLFDDALLADDAVMEPYRSFDELRVRMLSYGSFVWLEALFGEGLWKQRLFNVLLHLGTVAALWAFYREILRHVVPRTEEGLPEGQAPEPLDRSPALGLAIAFFALNPVAVYAVAYAVQRSIVMATLFVVLALWAVARAAAGRGKGYYALAVVFYLAAVMSKEHALLMPLAAIPVYILIARPSRRHLALQSAVGLVLAGAAAAVLAARYSNILGTPFDEFSHVYLRQLAALNPDAPRLAYPLSIMNQAWLFFEYGFRWLVPYAGFMSINLRPPFPISWMSFPHVLGIAGYLAFVAGGFFLLLRHRDWRALLGLSMLLPALLFATEFATVWVQDPFVLYRSYLWAIGIPGLVFMLAHGPSAKVLLGVGVALAALLVWQGLDRVLSMSSPQRAWTDAILKLPSDPRAVGRWFPYLNRGSAYAERDQFNLALRDFEASASLGDMGMGALNMGSILAAQGKHAQALEFFERAHKEGYNLYNLPVQRGLALLALGRIAEAHGQFQAAAAMNPPSPTREVVWLNLGRTGMQLGRAAEAAKALEHLVAAEPRNAEGRYLLGMAYVTLNEHERARQVLDTLVRDDPNGRSYYARALANFGLKRKAEAASDIDNAIRLGPDNPHLREWKARIQAMP